MSTNMNEVEERIITAAVEDILAAGCSISVHDGEEFAVRRSTDKARILEETATTDETTFVIYEGDAHVGSVFLVHGLRGEVIADHTDSVQVEFLLRRATTIAEEHEND